MLNNCSVYGIHGIARIQWRAESTQHDKLRLKKLFRTLFLLTLNPLRCLCISSQMFYQGTCHRVKTFLSLSVSLWIFFLPSKRFKQSLPLFSNQLFALLQDWDFPHFNTNFDVKLPGVNSVSVRFEVPRWLKEDWEVHITGESLCSSPAQDVCWFGLRFSKRGPHNYTIFACISENACCIQKAWNEFPKREMIFRNLLDVKWISRKEIVFQKRRPKMNFRRCNLYFRSVR